MAACEGECYMLWQNSTTAPTLVTLFSLPFSSAAEVPELKKCKPKTTFPRSDSDYLAV